MAAYCTNTEVKTYLGITASGDDSLITTLISAAQAFIDNYTGRTFTATADTTRYLDPTTLARGDTLYLDRDLCSVATIKTDYDNGSSGDAVTDYITVPKNNTPYYAIRLGNSSTLSWTYTDNPEEGVTISGKWAYSTTPPADIKQACIRLAAYLYRQKDSQVFDITALPEQGVITVPQGLPRDVQIILDMYKRSGVMF